MHLARILATSIALVTSTSYAAQPEIEDVIQSAGVRYTLTRYIPSSRIERCPWPQAGLATAKTQPGAAAQINGSGCWVVDADWGDISVWIQDLSGKEVVRTLYSNAPKYRPAGILKNVEAWERDCGGEVPDHVACENRDVALAYLEQHKWCRTSTPKGEAWQRCP